MNHPQRADLQAVANFLDPAEDGHLPDPDTCQRVGKWIRQHLNCPSPGAQERAAFEAAMRPLHPEWSFTADPVFDYHNERTRCAWEGWKVGRGVRVLLMPPVLFCSTCTPTDTGHAPGCPQDRRAAGVPLLDGGQKNGR